MQQLFYAQKAVVSATLEFQEIDSAKNPNPNDFIDAHLGLIALYNKIVSLANQCLNDKDNPKWFSSYQSSLNLSKLLVDENFKRYGESGIANPLFQKLLNSLAQTAIERSLDFSHYKNDNTFKEEIFFWQEKIKAQNLLLATQESNALNFSKIPESTIQKNKILAAQIDSLEQKLFLATQQNDSIVIKKIQNGYLFSKKREREKIISNMEKDFPNYYTLKYDFEPVKLNQLQKSISENTLFLELSIANEGNTKGLYFLSLTNNEQYIFKANLLPNLTQKITSFNALLRSHNLLRADRRQKFINLLFQREQKTGIFIKFQFFAPSIDIFLGVRSSRK